MKRKRGRRRRRPHDVCWILQRGEKISYFFAAFFFVAFFLAAFLLVAIVPLTSFPKVVRDDLWSMHHRRI
jgi:hypothetical protein